MPTDRPISFAPLSMSCFAVLAALSAPVQAQVVYGYAPAPAAVQPGAYGGGFIEFMATGRSAAPRRVGPPHAAAAPGYGAPPTPVYGYGQSYGPPPTPAHGYGQAYGPPPTPTYGHGQTYGPAPTAAYAYAPAQAAPGYGYAPQAYAPQAHVSGRRGRYAPAATAAPAPDAHMPGAADPAALAVAPRRGVDPRYQRQEIAYGGPHGAGTLVVDTPNRYLYLVQGAGRAIRYGIGVGRPGFEWSGVKRVSRKAQWPDWRPPAEMRQRRPDLPTFMAGGPGNPLGARALYLGSSLYRIHGTNEPHTIGQNVSSGCIRMMNDDVIDLYDRVPVGAKVIVI